MEAEVDENEEVAVKVDENEEVARRWMRTSRRW